MTFLMERSISRHKAAFSIGLLAICSAGAAWAQQSRAGSPSGDPNTDFLIATAREWGGKQGYVFTCDEWKRSEAHVQSSGSATPRLHRRAGFLKLSNALAWSLQRRISIILMSRERGASFKRSLLQLQANFLQSSIRKTPAVSRRTTFGKRRHRQRRRQRLAMGEAGAALFCVSYCNYSRNPRDYENVVPHRGI